MKTLKRELVSKAERMEGLRLPPAPIRITFLIGDISDASVDIIGAYESRIESKRILLFTVRGFIVGIFDLGIFEYGVCMILTWVEYERLFLYGEQGVSRWK